MTPSQPVADGVKPLPEVGPDARNSDSSWRLFLAGEWTDSVRKQRLTVTNPATNLPIASVSLADDDDVDGAVSAAAAAFRSGVWRNKSAASRAGLLLDLARELRANSEDLALLETLNNGMPLRDSRAMVSRCAGICEFVSGVAQRAYGQSIPVAPRYLDFTVREPVGVCALIIPWNGPLISAIAKVAPALALGNTVVLKPSELTPLTALKLAEILSKLGLPVGVFNVVTGGADVGRALVSHPEVDKIAFTGSTSAGKEIMGTAAHGLKRLTLELGGKAPNIFFDDIDMADVVAGATSALLRNSGQTCIAGARILVSESRYDEFVDRCLASFERIRVGIGTDQETQLGPIVSRSQLNRIMGFLKLAVAQGATVHGAAPVVDGILAAGNFMRPGLVTNADSSMNVSQEEIFGPVGVVLPFVDEDHAIALANDTPYGLAAGVWTRDIKRALRVAREVRAGTVWVNTYGWNFTEAPMGGYKQSGIGRENGDAVIDAYTEVKNIVLETSEKTLDIFGVSS